MYPSVRLLSLLMVWTPFLVSGGDEPRPNLSPNLRYSLPTVLWHNPLLAGCHPLYAESEVLVTSMAQKVGLPPTDTTGDTGGGGGGSSSHHRGMETLHRLVFTRSPTAEDCKRLGWTWTGNYPRKIYMGFAFDNQISMLLLMLRELHTLVDQFILVETPFMHNGQPKPVYFDQIKESEEFAPYIHKIVRVTQEHFHPNRTRLNLRVQRTLAIKQANQLSSDPTHDLFITGAVDEIPKPPVLAMLKHCTGQNFPIDLGSETYVYHFGCLTDWIYHPIIATVAEMAQGRSASSGGASGEGADEAGGRRRRRKTGGGAGFLLDFNTVIGRGAWHLFNFFTADQLVLRELEETDQNRELASVRAMMAQCQFVRSRDVAIPVSPTLFLGALPSAVLQHRREYATWLPTHRFSVTKESNRPEEARSLGKIPPSSYPPAEWTCLRLLPEAEPDAPSLRGYCPQLDVDGLNMNSIDARQKWRNAVAALELLTSVLRDLHVRYILTGTTELFQWRDQILPPWVTEIELLIHPYDYNFMRSSLLKASWAATVADVLRVRRNNGKPQVLNGTTIMRPWTPRHDNWRKVSLKSSRYWYLTTKFPKDANRAIIQIYLNDVGPTGEFLNSHFNLIRGDSHQGVKEQAFYEWPRDDPIPCTLNGHSHMCRPKMNAAMVLRSRFRDFSVHPFCFDFRNLCWRDRIALTPNRPTANDSWTFAGVPVVQFMC